MFLSAKYAMRGIILHMALIAITFWRLDTIIFDPVVHEPSTGPC